MKIDLGTVCRTPLGEPLKEGAEPLTLHLVFSFALDQLLPSDGGRGWDDKLALFTLSEKVRKAGASAVEFSAAEIEHIRERVGAVFKHVVVGFVDLALRGEPLPTLNKEAATPPPKAPPKKAAKRKR